MISRVAFLVGCWRSGTTWLRRSLGSHPLVLGLRETQVFSGEGKPDAEGQKKLEQGQFWKLLARYRAGPARFEDPVFELLPPATIERLAELCRTAETYPSWDAAAIEMFRALDGLRPWILEKTPRHVFRLHRIKLCFPDARILAVVRDGRDVLCSVRRLDMPWTRRFHDPLATARCWTRAQACILEALEAWPEDVLLIRYEELLTDYLTVADRIVRFLDCPLPPRALETLARQNSFEAYTGRARGQPEPGAFFSQGISGTFRRELTGDEIRQFESVAGPMLARFGYPLAASASRTPAPRENAIG